jgi:hypothetical protein
MLSQRPTENPRVRAWEGRGNPDLAREESDDHGDGLLTGLINQVRNSFRIHERQKEPRP